MAHADRTSVAASGSPVDARLFGESLLVYRPPIDTRSVKAVMGEKSNGNPEKALNFLTPHQKWGIH